MSVISLRVFSVPVFLWYTHTSHIQRQHLNVFLNLYLCMWFHIWCFFGSNHFCEWIDRSACVAIPLVQSKYQNVDAIAFGSFVCWCAVRALCVYRFHRFNIRLDLLWLRLRYATCYSDVFFMIRFAQLCIASMLPMPLYTRVNECECVIIRWWWRRRWNVAMIFGRLISLCSSTPVLRDTHSNWMLILSD